MKTTMMKDKKAVKSIVKTRVLFQKWLEIDAKLYKRTGQSLGDIFKSWLLRKEISIQKKKYYLTPDELKKQTLTESTFKEQWVKANILYCICLPCSFYFILNFL